MHINYARCDRIITVDFHRVFWVWINLEITSIIEECPISSSQYHRMARRVVFPLRRLSLRVYRIIRFDAFLREQRKRSFEMGNTDGKYVLPFPKREERVNKEISREQTMDEGLFPLRCGSCSLAVLQDRWPLLARVSFRSSVNKEFKVVRSSLVLKSGTVDTFQLCPAAIQSISLLRSA